eukprot:6204613-Pleurochrysis_carterae.AAC.3
MMRLALPATVFRIFLMELPLALPGLRCVPRYLYVSTPVSCGIFTPSGNTTSHPVMSLSCPSSL